MLPLRSLAAVFQRSLQVLTKQTSRAAQQNGIHTLSRLEGSTDLLGNRLQSIQKLNSSLPALNLTFTRSYQRRYVLEKRCPKCFFVTRKGQLFVECKAKPRHKQIQLIAKHKVFKDDYTEGKWREMVYAKHKQERWYMYANPKFVKFNWLGNRLGKEV